MSKIFFTSDQHFGHANIIKLTNRPFANAEEMDRELIRRWNERVAPEDEVYHLGDFALSTTEALTDVLNQLNGTIYLIKGNHDKTALALPKRFKWIKDYHEVTIKDPDAFNGSRLIILFHYAMRIWRNDFRESWHLYGHTHGTLPDKEHKLAIDVGVDCHDFYPISYDEVKAIMKRKQWKAPFGPR
ncbi:MAG: phosphoesterase [Flavobacterium sp. BFFFF1]|uniref:metallophosphoesterase family protein n=1 Tax=Flavobacterium sp. BFFFF1 TaxID=2015557 RepID=UPI000BD459D2|nr:metallophosphoesterase family protein [Flavobacterium sp. BFFFF1]OYU81772.1 MAG: phosphoesterase [Flavobacterium sp. BFFFF1]